MSINEKGYWEGLEAESQHAFDPHLSYALLMFFKKENPKTIADFGCGMGHYVKHLRENEINAFGFDGNPNTPELTNGLGKVLDLSVEKQFEESFEWIISLEVGEHLPKEYEDIFVDNLHNNNTKGLIVSWAIPGQGGHGHYNEQSNEYIKSKICELGYYNDIQLENHFRRNASLGYFKNTIMVFIKK